MTINERMKAVLERRGMTAKECAQKIGVQTYSVLQWTTDKEPRLSDLVKFCQGMGVSADVLLGLREEEPEKPEKKETGGSVNLWDPETLVAQLRKDAKAIREHTDRDACHIWHIARHCESAAKMIELGIVGKEGG